MNIRKITAGLLTLGLCAALALPAPVKAAEDAAPEEQSASQEETSSITTNAIPGWPQGPDITSTAAVVMETSTNTILYGKNVDHPLYPAAAVKIMTILLALENSSMEDQVTITATGVSGATDGGANISAQLDEVFTMEQCLYAIMLASANDIAMQVAEHIAGSLEAFAEMMNARAKELGCTGSVFTNPTGLPDENQHITAHDMALILKEAMTNDTFRTIASASSYTIPPTNVSGGERVLSNNFPMRNPTSSVYYENCLWGKEGATAASGSTLVCAAEKNGMQVVAVVLQNVNDQINAETVTLLDYAFNNFKMLSAGADDFNLLSGGTVVIPADAGEGSLTLDDQEADGKISRTYLFNGIPVGTASLMVAEAQDASVLEEGERNMAATATFSNNKTVIPYYVIGCAAAFLLILLIRLLIKTAKS